MSTSRRFRHPPLGRCAMRIHPDELQAGEDAPLAVTEDDDVVELVSWTRVRCGAAGTGESVTSDAVWDCAPSFGPVPGLYARFAEFGTSVARHADARRFRNGDHRSRWLDTVRSLPGQILQVEEMARELVEDGWEPLFAQFR